MAQTYEQWKKSYEGMTSEQQKQYNDILKTKGADYIGNQYMSQYNSANTPQTWSSNTWSSYTYKSEYAWQWSKNAPEVKDTSWNKGSWNYVYDDKSWYYQKQETPTTTTGWATWGTPSVTTWGTAWGTTTWETYWDKLRSAWNNMTPEQQQAALQKSPALKDNLKRYGIVVWETPATTDTWKWEWKPETPQTWDGWDYQDNSPERMAQIADNVNKLAASDPNLFTDEDAFRRFFIDWKWRTPEQEQFLMDLFKNRKLYNDLDNYTSGQIWNMYVNGRVPDSYLNYLKLSNPQRYAEIMDAKAKAEDDIRDTADYDTISFMSGDTDGLSTSKVIEWLKAQWLLVDKDWNLIDDRTENYASEEEKWYQREIADINARNLEIDNIVKHTYEDYVKKYPWATKATLMAMAQDTNSDLLREKENNLVQLTRLQGYVWYMQQEREDRTQIWREAISQLQKEYWMYYQYSPEWMSEIAQAQYAATNVTLDQADKWTYTQKQMALESALTPIFEKYWTLIERSMPQVINDVIAYSQNKWVSLSQALEENFMQYLKKKPWFSQLNTVQTEPYVVKVWDVAYKYNPDTDTFEIIWWSSVYWWWVWGTGWYQFSEAEVRTWDTIWNDINSIWHILASDDWLRVWTYHNEKNWYTYNVYADREDWIKATENLLRKSYYGMSLQDAAQKWIWQWKDISGAKSVIQQLWLWLNDKLSDANVRKFIEAMWTWEGTLKWWQSLDDWAKSWKNDFSEYRQRPTTEVDNQNQKFSNLTWWNNDWYSNSLVKDYEQYIADPSKVSKTDIESKYAPMWMTYYDFTTQAQNYARTWMKDKYVNSVSNSLEAAIELYEYINWNKAKFEGRDLWNWSSLMNDMFRWWNVQAWLLSKLYSYIPTTKQYDAKSYFDALNNRETLQKLIETKAQWATYWAMSEWEWKLLASASNLLDRNQSSSEFQKNLENLIYALSTAVEEWWGTLPTNYYKSSASNMVRYWEEQWRRKRYKEDNTPFYADINYDTYSTNWPSEI